MKNILVYVLAFIGLSSPLLAQHLCGSVVDIKKVIELNPVLANPLKNYQGVRPMVRLALHRVTRTDGTRGNNWQDIRRVVQGLSNFFEPANICFTVVSEDDVNNTDFFNMIVFIGDNWIRLLNTNRVLNAINIYFVPDADDGGIATGFLYNHPVDYPTVTLSNTVSRGRIATFNSEALAHELGHCLGLGHTHDALCVEEIPRTNCTTCGDLLCDTPADFGLELNTDNVNEQTCQYVGNEVLNGFTYAPDVRNIMSYTFPRCMNGFTRGQMDRMRNFIFNTNFFDDYVIRPNVTLSGNVNGSHYYSSESSIISDAVLTGGNNIYEAGGQIVLNPGFTITASSNNSFDARIGNYSCLEPLIRNSGLALPQSGENLTANSHKTQLVSTNLFVNVSPNPFSEALSIDYNLLKKEQVEITLRNMLGQTIQVIRDLSEQEPGAHKLAVEGGLLAPGVYFVNFKSETENKTIKVIKE
jgi:hypothetical protein